MQTKEKQSAGMAIRIPVKLNEKVKRIATKERRTRIDQLSIFLELGIAEYERRQRFVQDVTDGKTQIDPSLIGLQGSSIDAEEKAL